jgi:hypothetical protein
MMESMYGTHAALLTQNTLQQMEQFPLNISQQIKHSGYTVNNLVHSDESDSPKEKILGPPNSFANYAQCKSPVLSNFASKNVDDVMKPS